MVWGKHTSACHSKLLAFRCCRGSSFNVSLVTCRKPNLQVTMQREQVDLFFGFPCTLHFWLPLPIELLWERLIPTKCFCHSPLTISTLLTRLEQEMFQQNKLQLVMRKNNHAALPSFSHLSSLSCLGFHTRQDQSHFPSCAKVSEAGKHVFVSDIPVHLRDCSVAWDTVPDEVSSVSWRGREESDLKACQ